MHATVCTQIAVHTQTRPTIYSDDLQLRPACVVDVATLCLQTASAFATLHKKLRAVANATERKEAGSTF
jgi:hypothetical protein